jgi:hypothetical protein
MPTKLPEEVEKSIAVLRDPTSPFDYIEHAGWLVARLWETEDEYFIVASVIVARSAGVVPPAPRAHGQWRSRPK